MFENVDGRTTNARAIGILIAHLGAFGSGELINTHEELLIWTSKYGGHTYMLFFMLLLCIPRPVSIIIFGRLVVCFFPYEA